MERIEEEQDIDVYIDGSCINNGKINAKAGYGVFFETDDCRNESNVVQGKQTNNTGELTAMIRALEILKKEIEDKRNINIYTDSEYVMKCSGSYGEKLAKNNWKTKEDKIPPNLKLLQKIYELYHGNKKHIKLHHIKAHTNLSDKHSIGNSQADRLANLAVNPNFEERDEDICGFKNLSVVVASSAKNFINVSYTYKDAVKKLGCKWDINKKKWYYEDHISEENIKSIKDIENLSLSTEKEKPARNNTGESGAGTGTGAGGASGESSESKRVYIKVAFKNKDAVKKHGCKWDPEKKSWYYFADTDKNKIEEIMKLI
jgi:ribonuclease HI